MKITSSAASLLVVATAAFAAGLGGQTPGASSPQTRPTFEVASVKPHDPADRMPILNVTTYQPGGRFRGTNVTIGALIRQAYGTRERPLRAAQLDGGPGWINTQGFDIVATAGDPAITQEAFLAILPKLLQSLLEDRFKLQTHVEQRPLPVYTLVFARADKRPGPQLRPTKTDCDAYARDTTIPKPTARDMANGAALPPCAYTRSGPGRIQGNGITLRALAGSLGADRIVLDRTDQPGLFDIDLQWTPETTRAAAGDPSGTAALADGASIFTALQEQLGLKLEPTREPMDVLVIDRVERPTPD